MKKIILSLAFAVAVLTSAVARTTDNDPGFIVRNAFSKEFADIKEVKWDELNKNGVYTANFTFNNETLQAYFTEEGEFLGTTRKVTRTQFPILLTRELDKRYADAKFVSAFELSTPSGLDYYITLSTKKDVLVIKATGTGDLTVYQRQRR